MGKNRIVKIRYQFSVGDKDEVWIIRDNGNISMCRYRECCDEYVEEFFNAKEIRNLFEHVLKCMENTNESLENEDGNVAIFYQDGSIIKICSSLDDGTESIRDIIEGHILSVA